MNPDNGHGAGDGFPGSDYPTQEEILEHGARRARARVLCIACGLPQDPAPHVCRARTEIAAIVAAQTFGNRAAGLHAAHDRDGRPSLPIDRVRLHVALWKLAHALGLEWTTVDALRPDHELVEQIAQAVKPALSAAFRRCCERDPDDQFRG